MAFQSTSISSRQNNSLFTHSLWLLISVNLLVGCGGGEEGGSGAILQGQFIDSPVYGLAYFSGNQSGKTDSEGRFNYQEGTDVTFMIGDIVIGKGPGAPIMTPVSLVPGAVDETHPVVLNIARFLQTLDTDQKAANGITIDPYMHTLAEKLSVDFSLSGNNFEDQVQGVVATLTSNNTFGAQLLVTSPVASNHLKSSLLSLYAGSYAGQVSGDLSGNLQLFIDEQGILSGTMNDGDIFTYELTGSLYSNGLFTFSAISIDNPNPNNWFEFNGNVDYSGVVTGWSDNFPVSLNVNIAGYRISP